MIQSSQQTPPNRTLVNLHSCIHSYMYKSSPLQLTSSQGRVITIAQHETNRTGSILEQRHSIQVSSSKQRFSIDLHNSLPNVELRALGRCRVLANLMKDNKQHNSNKMGELKEHGMGKESYIVHYVSAQIRLQL